MSTERKYKDNEYVLIGYPSPHLKVIVETAVECLAGWRYKLRYLRKDQITVDKRSKKGTWYFEDKIHPI